jgi:hypothetical protein
MMRNKLRTWKFTVAYPVLLWCLSVGLAYGASNGEKVKIKGVIATRTGETLVVTSATGDVTVVLTDDTKVQQPKGLGARKKQMEAAVLVPGLRVTVEGVGDAQSRVTAKSINFDSEDLDQASSQEQRTEYCGKPTGHSSQFPSDCCQPSTNCGQQTGDRRQSGADRRRSAENTGKHQALLRVERV